MNPATAHVPLVDDELEVLSSLVPLSEQRIIELGCGAAQLARSLLTRWPGCVVTALEVDQRQHAKNLAQPQERLTFLAAGAQAIPESDARFDLALMLKSLHHVPRPLMATALGEVARVLRPGGNLYVSEPVYDGPFNALVRLFNDEGTVRAAAQLALDAALRTGGWEPVAEQRFEMPVHFRHFEDFEHRMMRPTFADHAIDDAKLAAVRRAFEPHCTSDGARFVRPMHVRLLRRCG
ncbi:MAG: class I SAM-dependent methyltransferase [Rubrivivax sp.]|nr:class I SAM-dependent methyltransferase [Rubrivivax sp.]